MYYHNFLVILATFNEYHWSFFTSGAQISYKTNTVGRSVVDNLRVLICMYSRTPLSRTLKKIEKL